MESFGWIFDSARNQHHHTADWAKSKNILGTIYGSLSDHQSDDEAVLTLKKAIASFEAALEIFTYEASQIGWASTQTNLGISLKKLGLRLGIQNGGEKHFHSALKAFNAALVVKTRDELVLEWSLTQFNIGGVFRDLGERIEGNVGIAYLEQGVEALRRALEIQTPEQSPYYNSLILDQLERIHAVLVARRRKS